MRKGRGEITHIGSLFESYVKRLKPPQESVVRTFVEVVEEVLSISLDTSQIKYSVHNKTLSLNVSGMVKSEVRLHEKDILAHLKGRLGEQSAPQHII